jgi:UDP-glucose:(heptosyl)LPS alpha-1,3-glucosyltransferase
MRIALCYESVLPARGGCETYIADLARHLDAAGHEIHVVACRWDAAALPKATRYQELASPRGLRCYRPWSFARACLDVLARDHFDLSIGFNKTWGQDILMPLAGLHLATLEGNLRRHASSWQRHLARAIKAIDLASWSYAWLEKRQYLASPRPQVIVNSRVVADQFRRFYGLDPNSIHVVHSAIDPQRFVSADRSARRAHNRRRWGCADGEVVGLFTAMNYRLKGLTPLLQAVARVPASCRFRLLVLGHPHVRPFERLARRLGIAAQVRFGGHCSDMRDGYLAADFLLHPTFYDPCSLVVLEALACGLPVVTTRYNGAAELLRPPRDSEVIDDPHDHARLAACIARFCDAAERAACAREVPHTAARWTFAQHYHRLLQIFERIAQGRRAA